MRGNSLSRRCGTQTHFLWNKCNAKRISFSHHKTTTHSSFTALWLNISFPLLVSSSSSISVQQECEGFRCAALVLSLWRELKVHLTEICCSTKEDGFTDSFDFFFPLHLQLPHRLAEVSSFSWQLRKGGNDPSMPASCYYSKKYD